MRPAHWAALADCAGQLALIEAFRGNLELATRHGDVARASQGHGRLTGIGGEHALLASAWVHLERGHDAEARELIERLPHTLPGTREPWLVTARLVAEARLLTVEGRPDSALRLLAGWEVASSTGDGGWLDELVAIASAEALIAAGEPDRALASLTPVPQRTAVEAGVLSAIARRDIGDLRGAGAGLAAASVGPRGKPPRIPGPGVGARGTACARGRAHRPGAPARRSSPESSARRRSFGVPWRTNGSGCGPSWNVTRR